MASIPLNRKLQNHAFESWQIGSSFVKSRHTIKLSAPVYLGAGEAVDFQHTRAAALRNHLIHSLGRHFVVVNHDNGGLQVHEVVDAAADDAAGATAAAGLQLQPVAVIPSSPSEPLIGSTVEAALHCSLVLIASIPQAQDAAAAPAAPQDQAPSPALPVPAPDITGTQPGSNAAATAAGWSLSPDSLLVSTGTGNLVLVEPAAYGQEAITSNFIWPLRPQAPATGVRPFSLEAAWMTQTGHIMCVISTLSHRTVIRNGTTSSVRAAPYHHSSWVSDTWVITLKVTTAAATAGTAARGSLAAHGSSSTSRGVELQQQHHTIAMVDSQQLLTSPSPPAAVVGGRMAAGSVSEAVLVVGEPPCDNTDTLGPSRCISAASAADAGGGSKSQAAANAGHSNGNDGDDIDPRTLQQAAARLAKYTSEQQLGDLPQQQWTDVFRESGPGDIGPSEAQPSADIMLFTTTGSSSDSPLPPPAAADGNAAASQAGHTGNEFTLTASMSCGPHKLLAVQHINPVNQHTGVSGMGVSGLQKPSSQYGLFLGLTDDVDCAVVAAEVSAVGGGAAAAWFTPVAADAAGNAASNAEGNAEGNTAGVLHVSHEGYLPALAYVVAGKTQRRHLLLGSQCSPVGAVLVEVQKYAYVYGQVDKWQAHGRQQIVDMELPAGSSILGAALLETSGSTNSSNGVDSSDGVNANPGDGMVAEPAVRLLLLTNNELIWYVLGAPV